MGDWGRREERFLVGCLVPLLGLGVGMWNYRFALVAWEFVLFIGWVGVSCEKRRVAASKVLQTRTRLYYSSESRLNLNAYDAPFVLH